MKDVSKTASLWGLMGNAGTEKLQDGLGKDGNHADYDEGYEDEC